MVLVAGVDSSTQSCKVVVVDAATGAVVREGSAPHPDGTSCPPEAWWAALLQAIESAGGLDDVAAISVGGQQHGMVCLDADGAVIRDALLWNDTRSGDAAQQLTDELGAEAWADGVGSVPRASYTVTKLRWLADAEPANAERIAAVCLPHDWLTWRLLGGRDLAALVTDRSDASGTGYFDPVANRYRRDLLALALRRPEADVADIILPRVLGPSESAGNATGIGLDHVLVGPGCGDNAGAALGMGVQPAQTWLSLGTSGVVAAVSDTPFHDAEGLVSGFADATGRYLPLQATLNGARIVDGMTRALGVDHAELAELALAAAPGSGGMVHVPFLEGERTPNLPTATGSLLGMTLGAMTRENLARAAVEGMLCLLASCVERLVRHGAAIDSVLLIGGGAKSPAARAIAPEVLCRPVVVPGDAQYVALGAAKQAAWVLVGGDEPPAWPQVAPQSYEAAPRPELLERWEEAVALVGGGLPQAR